MCVLLSRNPVYLFLPNTHVTVEYVTSMLANAAVVFAFSFHRGSQRKRTLENIRALVKMAVDRSIENGVIYL